MSCWPAGYLTGLAGCAEQSISTWPWPTSPSTPKRRSACPVRVRLKVSMDAASVGPRTHGWLDCGDRTGCGPVGSHGGTRRLRRSRRPCSSRGRRPSGPGDANTAIVAILDDGMAAWAERWQRPGPVSPAPAGRRRSWSTSLPGRWGSSSEMRAGFPFPRPGDNGGTCPARSGTTCRRWRRSTPRLCAGSRTVPPAGELAGALAPARLG